MIVSPKRAIRAGLRRARSAIWLGREAWERRHEFGWRGLATRTARRLTGTRARDPDAAVKNLSTYGVPAVGSEFDVIYAIGYWHGTPKRYRVFNMAEGLGAVGYAVHVMDFDRLDDIRRYRWRATALVLFRAEYDRLIGMSEVLDYARGAGMRLVYDIDDLVFDPALAGSIDVLHRMLPYERRRNLQAMERRRELLLACDLVTVSTAPLAKIAERLGRPAAIIPNSINGEQQRVAAALAAAPSRRCEGVLVGYFSGSATHQRDFAKCERRCSTSWSISRRASLRRLSFSRPLGPLCDRIERIISRRATARCIAETDINLAPLE